MSFDHLNQGNFDIGFTTTKREGHDYHQVTRDITLSIQRFHEGHLINLFYTGGQPVRVELTDKIVPYYSDYIEWRYILEGHLEINFEGTVASFEEDEICFMNSAALHEELPDSSECVVINMNINRVFFNERFLEHITLTPLQKFLRTNLLHLGHVEKYLKFTPVSSDMELIRGYIFSIMNEVRFQQVGYLDISRGYLIRIMDTLSTGFQYNFRGEDSSIYYETLFESVSEYMKDHLSTVTMDSLIETFHYQTAFFNRLIKRYTGLTYSNYLISLRIEKAKELLLTTDLSIEEIIWLVGYHNRGFFYRRFSEAVGMNPAAYRKTQQLS